MDVNLDEILHSIRFSFVGIETRSQLALKLDPHSHQGKDWRGLADRLDYTGDEIEVRNILSRYQPKEGWAHVAAPIRLLV